MERLGRLSLKISLLLTVLSLPNLSPFPPLNYWHELNISLGTYYLLTHFATALALLAFSKFIPRRFSFYLHLSLQFALTAAYAVVLIPYCTSGFEIKSAAKYKLYYANAYRYNRTPELIAKQISDRNPDIVALTEFSDELDRVLRLEQNYQYFIKLSQDDCFGLALYSKFPIGQNPITSLGGDLPPQIITSLQLPENKTVILSLNHLLPPLSGAALYKNTLIVRRLAQQMRHEELPVLVVGDFNATPFSWFYMGFRQITDLDDAASGFGIRKTWNANHIYLWFIIDHVFKNQKIGVQSLERLEANGSDHYPLMLEFNVD